MSAKDHIPGYLPGDPIPPMVFDRASMADLLAEVRRQALSAVDAVIEEAEREIALGDASEADLPAIVRLLPEIKAKRVQLADG